MSSLRYKNYLILISESVKGEDILKLINCVCKDIKEEDKRSISLHVLVAKDNIDMSQYHDMLKDEQSQNLVSITIIVNPSKLEIDMYLIHDTIITLCEEPKDSILYFEENKYIHCPFDNDTYPERKF